MGRAKLKPHRRQFSIRDNGCEVRSTVPGPRETAETEEGSVPGETGAARGEGISAQIPIKILQPWLVWLSGLSAGLQTERLPVRFPVRAHAWVVGQVRGHARGNQLMYLLHINVSLPFSLPPPLSNK